jgi:Ca2+-binding EF-hand superfamily protein
VPQLPYPGTTANYRYRSISSDNPFADLPLVILTGQRNSVETIIEKVHRIESLTRCGIEDTAIVSLIEGEPAETWSIRVDQSGRPIGIAENSNDRAIANEKLFSRGRIRFYLHCDEGRLGAQTADAEKLLDALFHASDINNDGIVDPEEIAGSQKPYFKQIAQFADRNQDQNLSRAELNDLKSLWEAIAKNLIHLSIIDHEQWLFELLDADHDGTLSVGELDDANPRLQTETCIEDERFDSDRLPRQLRAVVSHGLPRRLLSTPATRGPKWFVAMDRNQDQLISRAEFAGSGDLFQKLDQNQNGYIDLEESAAAQ